VSIHCGFEAISSWGQKNNKLNPNKVKTKLKDTKNNIKDDYSRGSRNCQDGAIAVVIDVGSPDPICRKANRRIIGPMQGFLAHAKSPENEESSRNAKECHVIQTQKKRRDTKPRFSSEEKKIGKDRRKIKFVTIKKTEAGESVGAP
jgi:hypothetical protein